MQQDFSTKKRRSYALNQNTLSKKLSDIQLGTAALKLKLKNLFKTNDIQPNNKYNNWNHFNLSNSDTNFDKINANPNLTDSALSQISVLDYPPLSKTSSELSLVTTTTKETTSGYNGQNIANSNSSYPNESQNPLPSGSPVVNLLMEKVVAESDNTHLPIIKSKLTCCEIKNSVKQKSILKRTSLYEEVEISPENLNKLVLKTNLKKKKKLLFNEVTDIFETWSEFDYPRLGVTEKSFEISDDEEFRDLMEEEGELMLLNYNCNNIDEFSYQADNRETKNGIVSNWNRLVLQKKSDRN
ncbi:hypothetical protein HDU92_003458 [Lobulomyces angularis]|nr:hypothetical protein HDU92_003458 [Lobulomyces angularis]